MIDCVLAPHPTDPALCWCPVCKRTLPARLLHARRNCLVPDGPPPEPRPEEEQAALVEVCKTCPEYGDKNPDYLFAPVCQLDAPESGERKAESGEQESAFRSPLSAFLPEPCRKKAMVAAYQKRVQFTGNDCGPWRESVKRQAGATDNCQPATASVI